MESQQKGKQSFLLSNQPVICAWASVGGKKEKEGPLSQFIDITRDDVKFGERTWEQAEKRMQQLALGKLAEKSGQRLADFGLVLSGDLLNQCIGSSYSLRNKQIPHLGLYPKDLNK